MPIAARGIKSAQSLTVQAMQENSPFIDIKDLTKSYKRGQIRALDGVNLTVKSGEILGLIGPNGAGKSTLIGCLLGLLKPDSGEIKILDRPADFLSIRRITGYVPERPDFEGWMTGRLFLEYHFMLSGADKSGMSQAVDEALEQVELSAEVSKRKLGTYSRGMLQRLSLAQCLVGQPRMLLLDEPTLGLDPTGVAVVRRLVASFRKSGMTAIINSHQLDEVERECDRVAFMRAGKIEQVENLKASPSGSYVLFVRWTADDTNGHSMQDLTGIARQAGVTIKERNGSWARFVVSGGSDAANLLKLIVNAGYPLEEAVTERGRLERLFVSPKDQEKGA